MTTTGNISSVLNDIPTCLPVAGVLSDFRHRCHLLWNTPIEFHYSKESLINSGWIGLWFKMIKFKAWNASNSRAIAKFHNMGIGHFGHNAFIHELIRGSLTVSFINSPDISLPTRENHFPDPQKLSALTCWQAGSDTSDRSNGSTVFLYLCWIHQCAGW